MEELSDLLAFISDENFVTVCKVATYAFVVGSVASIGWIGYQIREHWRDYKSGLENERIRQEVYNAHSARANHDGWVALRWGTLPPPKEPPQRGTQEWWYEARLYRQWKESA